MSKAKVPLPKSEAIYAAESWRLVQESRDFLDGIAMVVTLELLGAKEVRILPCVALEGNVESLDANRYQPW